MLPNTSTTLCAPVSHAHPARLTTTNLQLLSKSPPQTHLPTGQPPTRKRKLSTCSNSSTTSTLSTKSYTSQEENYLLSSIINSSQRSTMSSITPSSSSSSSPRPQIIKSQKKSKLERSLQANTTSEDLMGAGKEPTKKAYGLLDISLYTDPPNTVKPYHERVRE